MRFVEYVGRHALAESPVDRFAGFVVEVGLPSGWEPVRAFPGLRVASARDEGTSGAFRPNAVLTTHCVAAAIDEGEVFAMLIDGPCRGAVLSAASSLRPTKVSGCRNWSHGALYSVSRSRIIKYGQETTIAQLTVTALRDLR